MIVKVVSPTEEIRFYNGAIWLSLQTPQSGGSNFCSSQNRLQGIEVPQVFSGPKKTEDGFDIEQKWGESGYLKSYWYDPVTGQSHEQMISPVFKLDKDATYTWDMSTNMITGDGAWPLKTIALGVAGVGALAVLAMFIFKK